MIPYGISQTSNSYLGNLVGEGKTRIAKNLSKVGVILTFMLYLVYIVIGTLLKPMAMKYFTTDEMMAQNFSKVYNIYLYIFFFADCY